MEENFRLLMGDFNFIVNSETEHYPPIKNTSKQGKDISKFMKSINLVDISRFNQKYGLLYSRIYKKNKSCSRIQSN